MSWIKKSATELYTLLGTEKILHNIHTTISPGMYKIHIAGIPSTKKKDIYETILGALISSGFDSPKTKAWKVHISITPALSTKTCGDVVLPIALEILKASKQINTQIHTGYGTLDIHGNIQSNSRSAAYLYLHRKLHPEHIILAPQQIQQDKYPIQSDHNIWKITSLSHLRKGSEAHSSTVVVIKRECDLSRCTQNVDLPIWLACAIISGLHTFIWGSNGVGKTILSERICSIRLPINKKTQEGVIVRNHEWISTNGLFIPINRISCAQETIKSMLNKEPVGCIQKNISGVVILDEFLHASQKDLNLLLDIMDHQKSSPDFVQIIAMTNSCPCGNLGSNKTCACNKQKAYQYRNKIHQGLIDRFGVFKHVDHESKTDETISIKDIMKLWESFEEDYVNHQEKTKQMLLMSGISTHLYSYRKIDQISRFATALSRIQNTNITGSVIKEALEYNTPPGWLMK